MVETIFVFGSNLAGRHLGGAAKCAAEKHGAQDGIGEGPTGQSYALPTMDVDIQPRHIAYIAASIDKFLRFALDNPELRFRVTRVGCGIAGFTDDQIAPHFLGAPSNCEFDPLWSTYGLKTWDREEVLNG
jgi:hypothetical protein